MQSLQTIRRKNLIARPVTLALLSLPVQAFAEEANINNMPQSAETTVERILVTAQKRSERLQDVPLSMEVLDAQKLAENGKSKFSDYFAEIPGLSFYSNAMSSAIVMRGIGTDVGIGTRPTSGITIDDVPYGSATNTGVMPDLDPSDIQQIEVLRGPQGTLYGASSMGGLLKYVSVDPSSSYTTARIEAGAASSVGGGAGHSFRASGNLPVSENFAVRASAFKRKDPWFVENTRDGANNAVDSEGGRIATKWQLTDRISIKSSALFQGTEYDGTATVDTTNALVPVYDQHKHARMVGSDNFTGKVRFYTNQITAELDWATLDAITGYSEHRSAAKQDVSYTTIGTLAPRFAQMLELGYNEPGAVIDNRYDEDKVSQELRLSSPDKQQLQWQTGLFYTREKISSTQNFFLGDQGNGAVFEAVPLLMSVGKDSYRETSAFANITYQWTDKLDTTFGGRFAKNTIKTNGVTGGLLTSAETSDSHYSDNVFTYLLSGRYKFNNDLMAYLRIASGYRAGGSNSNLVDDVPQSYDSDTLVSYELGIKGTVMDTLVLDAALFRINWSDLQLSQIDLTFGESYTTNAGKAVSQGVELGAGYTFADHWRLKLNYAFTDATLAEDIPGYVEGSTAYGRKGDRLPFSTRNSGTVSLNHDMDLQDSLLLSVSASINYQGERLMQFTQSENLPRLKVPSYTTVGLSSTLSSGPWAATLYVNNLFDKVGYHNASRRSAPGQGAEANWGAVMIQPRTLGITLSWEF